MDLCQLATPFARPAPVEKLSGSAVTSNGQGHLPAESEDSTVSAEQPLTKDSTATRTLVAQLLESPPRGTCVVRVSRFVHDGRALLTKVADTTKAVGEGIAEAVLDAAAGGSGEGYAESPCPAKDYRTPGCVVSFRDAADDPLKEIFVHPLEPGFEGFALGKALTGLPSHDLRVELFAPTAGVLERWSAECPAGEPLWREAAREAVAASADAARDRLFEVIRDEGGKVVDHEGRIRLRISDGKVLSSRLWALFSLAVYGICFSLFVWIALPVLLLSSRVRRRVLTQVRSLTLGDSLRYEYRLLPGAFEATCRRRLRVVQALRFPWQKATIMSFAPRAVPLDVPQPSLRVLLEGTLQEIPIPTEGVGAALRALLLARAHR